MAQSKQKSKAKSKQSTHSSLESDSESEHELFYYASNRIKLMKEVLKLIKPKKIKSVAPDFMKSLDIQEINSMLLEELLGISNKRLKHILNGENVDVETSSSESDDEKAIDVISLDDITDSDDEFGLVGASVPSKDISKKDKKEKNKKKKVPKPIKQEKLDKPEKSKKKSDVPLEKMTNESENEKLMSVLEILELQARARAIRSQLALESVTKKQQAEKSANAKVKQEHSDDSDAAIVVDSPRNEEIIITSSESENEHSKSHEKGNKSEMQKVKKVRDCSEVAVSMTPEAPVVDETKETPGTIEEKKQENVTTEPKTNDIVISENLDAVTADKTISETILDIPLPDKSDSENDDVINLDIEEMEND